MTRTMYDAVNPAAVPATGWDLLAGYVNGALIKPSYPGLRARFPHATIVGIDTQNKPGSAQVCDIEQGDARPDEAPAWFDASLRAGIVRPTLYYSSSLHGEIVRYMGHRKFDAWVASYGVRVCPVKSDAQVTVVAWQKADHGPHGENIDISDVFDPYWPHAAPAPVPIPITWKEITLNAHTSYVKVPTDANGKGVLDLGTTAAPVGFVPDLDVRDHPGFAYSTARVGNGNHAIVVVGAPPNSKSGIGFYVTVSG